MASRKIMSMVVVVVALAAVVVSSEAQSVPGGGGLSCIQALMPCTNYLNATKPPATCCDPLKKAFETQLDCLCAAFNNPALIAAANVNVSDLLQLPMKCGFKADPTACAIGGPASAPMGLTPGASTSSSTPKGAPGSSGATSVGPVFGLFLVLGGFIFY